MVLHCFDLGCLEYPRALIVQEDLLHRRREGTGHDALLLVEHPPVFTLGRGAEEKNLLTPREVPVHRVSRGGEVTFHGPGQLVGYPLIDLANHGRDVHLYLRGLEAVLIDVLATCGIAARREVGKTGVWVNEKKIASIGVGVRRWVTYHGFALNVTTDLSYFADIVPCGLVGVRMTSMAELLPVAEVVSLKPLVAATFARYFGYKDIIWRTDLPTDFQTPNPEPRTSNP
ncbi:MAG: lipoyl(octanoyl) transferase [Deltaproteobacteria bacterium]|nr:lipoyl(octanoyl) transferase [Deltaproteobacteria bacterium]